jgi:glutathione S-transferase
MITLHHLEESRAHRVAWLIEELGVPYEIKRYPRNRQTFRAPHELRAIHPLGKSPIVVDTDGTVLVESAVILDRLLDRYGEHGLRPAAGTEPRHAYDYWMHYAEGSLMPNLLLKLVFTKMPKGAPGFLRPLVRAFAKKVASVAVDPEVALHLGYVEDVLAKRPFFAGETFSAADIQMSYPLIAARHRSTLGPKTSAYLETIAARPAYKRAAEKTGDRGTL